MLVVAYIISRIKESYTTEWLYFQKPEIIEVDSVYVNNITSNSSEKLHVHMVTFRNDGPYVSFSCNCSVNGQNDSSLFWFEEGRNHLENFVTFLSSGAVLSKD